MYRPMSRDELKRFLEEKRNELVTIMSREDDWRKRQYLARTIDGLDLALHAIKDLERYEQEPK